MNTKDTKKTQMKIMISKSYTSESFGEKPTLDQKIEIFRDRVEGWQLDVADILQRQKDAGYAVLAVLFSYFEMIAQFEKGKTSDRASGTFFRDGFRLVYPKSNLNDKQIDLAYSHIRCGMYHSGYTKPNTLISGSFADAILAQGDLVLANPHKLVEDLKVHFLAFIQNLKDQSQVQARENFQRSFDTGSGGEKS